MKKDTENAYVKFPEVCTRRALNAMYREIPLKDTSSRLLRKYFNAMANLYGVIPLRKAWEIIRDQSPNLASKEAFIGFAEIARHEREDYHILKDTELYLDGEPAEWPDWKIIHLPLLYEDDNSLYEVEISQQGKDYYIPPQAELLRYSDPFYYEPTPQANRLREFLSKTLRLGEQKASIAFDDIYLYTHCLNGSAQKAVDIVESLGAVLNKKTLTEFLSIHQDFNNNTRMQHNRGYTPNEIAAMCKPEDRTPKSISFGPNIRKSLADGTLDAQELMKGLLAADTPDNQLKTLLLHALEEAETGSKSASKTEPVIKTHKVGRNDPCPCGSGKKYKKCCGR